jgi:hypothetical protein
MRRPPRERLRLLADRLHAQRLWAHEDLFGAVFADAVARVYGTVVPDPDGARLVEYTFVSLITRPGDLVAVCRHILDPNLRLAVVEHYVRHPLAALEVLAANGGSAEVFRELPHGGWTEVAVYMYAAARLNADPGRNFDVEELLPFGMVDVPAARAALRSALDADQLTEAARLAFFGVGGTTDVPAPAFTVNDPVEVVLGTPRRGRVRRVFWHYKRAEWLFLLREETGRDISKWYAAEDLRGH